jgi:hypothetical protein
VIFPSIHQTTKVMHPGKEPLDSPSPLIAAQRTAILWVIFSTATVWSDHFDVVLLGEPFVERVGVVGFVADKSFWELFKEASGQNVFHKFALGWRSAVDSNGERKTVTSGDSDDLGTLTATGRTDSEAPFLALANVASTKASSRSSLPCSCNSCARSSRTCCSLPLPTHRWNRRWHVWNGGYRSGSSRHWAPDPKIHNTPFKTARLSCHGRPRLSCLRASLSTGSTNNHCSSVKSHRPAISLSRKIQSWLHYAPNSRHKGL